MLTIDGENLADADQAAEYGAAPVQAYGTLDDGRRFYFRSRHRRVTLEIGRGPEYDPAKDPAPAYLGFTLDGFPEDRHPLSYFDSRHVRPLIEFLSDVLLACEKQAEAPPYAYAWTELSGVEERSSSPGP